MWFIVSCIREVVCVFCRWVFISFFIVDFEEKEEKGGWGREEGEGEM